MKEENKEIIVILLAFFAAVFAICGAYGIAHYFIGGINSIIISIPFWILCGIFYLIAYLFIIYSHKKVIDMN